MKWKEFLKPDKRKIVLMILIPFLINLYDSYQYLFNPYMELTWLGDTEPPNIHVSLISKAFLDSIIITWWWSYPLSCLIIWIYNKVKKK